MTIKRCYPVIVGASVAENQLCNGESVTVPNGHKYYLKTGGTESLGASTGTAITGLTSGSDMVIDLTQMLGSTIADYVYTLEQATAGAGIAWLRSYGFLNGYQAYNAGSLESVEVTGKVVRGFNAWDEEWESGQYNLTTGAKASRADAIRCKNPIPVKPSTSYYFGCTSHTSTGDGVWLWYTQDGTLINYVTNKLNREQTSPSDAYYMTFYIAPETTYHNDICINLSSDRNGEYEAFASQTYDYGTDTLNGIFKLDSNNRLYADGDTKTSDGVITRKYKKIVIDGDTDIQAGASGLPFSINLADKKRLVNTTDAPNGITDKLHGVAQSLTWGTAYTFSFATVNNRMYFKLSDDITTIEDAKTWLASNPITLVYELATPTTEQSTPFTSPQICYPDGTEEFVTETDVPVGHETKYQL